MLWAFAFVVIYAGSLAAIGHACRDIGQPLPPLDESDVSDLYDGPR